MHAAQVLRGWDIVILVIPLAVIMISAMFGLDEHFASGQYRRGCKPRFCEVGVDGRADFCDPDGRSWHEDGRDCRGVSHSGFGHRTSGAGSGPSGTVLSRPYLLQSAGVLSFGSPAVTPATRGEKRV